MHRGQSGSEAAGSTGLTDRVEHADEAGISVSQPVGLLVSMKPQELMKRGDNDEALLDAIDNLYK